MSSLKSYLTIDYYRLRRCECVLAIINNHSEIEARQKEARIRKLIANLSL
jgi:hypothetical protein